MAANMTQEDARAEDEATAAPASTVSSKRELLIRKGHAFVNRVLDFSQRKYHRALGHAARPLPAAALLSSAQHLSETSD